MCARPTSARSPPMATNGSWGRRVARFSISRASFRTKWNRWSSDGPMQPASKTTPAATWHFGRMRAATNAARSTPSDAMACASIEFLLNVGIDRIAPVVQALGDRIADGVRERGYEILGERTAANGAGIVSFRKPGVDSGDIVAGLARNKISTASRAGWVRASPHFYITTNEIDTMLAGLP